MLCIGFVNLQRFLELLPSLFCLMLITIKHSQLLSASGTQATRDEKPIFDRPAVTVSVASGGRDERLCVFGNPSILCKQLRQVNSLIER